jgi:RNA polymerase sigma-70 factor (ECF subfamily)
VKKQIFAKKQKACYIFALIAISVVNQTCEIMMSQDDEMQTQLKKEAEASKATELYQRHASAILAYLRMHLPSWDVAEDVLVEVFLAALESQTFPALREEEQRSWLWRVTRNKVADYFRVAERRQTFSLDDVAETMYFDEELAPEQTLLRQEEYSHLRKSIQDLSPLQQRVLHLRFVSGLRCADIAAILGKSEAAVRMQLSRTLNLLRSIYEKH